MTSNPKQAYVWIWVAGQSQPTLCGRLRAHGSELRFTYAQRYLDHPGAVSIYSPELPLERRQIRPNDGLTIPGCINDASPDAWGQRVIMNRLLGAAASTRPVDLSALTYLLESGSDRSGALDFQASADEYIPRTGQSADLEELAQAAENVEEGLVLSKPLEEAFRHATSIGGARPKVHLTDQNRKLIAKLSAVNDTYSVVKGEFIAMRLAGLAGLNVANVELTRALNKDVLLVERFDRELAAEGWARLPVVSALTLLGLDEFLGARYASYADLADLVSAGFTRPAATLRELFSRITFNILVGNYDDHARNHAAFWDGATQMLTLTPAYDICPQPRNSGLQSQLMAIGRDGFRASQVAGCVDRADVYGLTKAQAREIVDMQITVIRENWASVCDEAQLSKQDQAYFLGRQFLHEYALEGY